MFKLFSERNKEPSDDVYTYDNIPTSFRNQLFYTISEIITWFNDSRLIDNLNLWELTHNLYCREKGLKELDDDSVYYRSKIEKYIDKSSDMDLLDFIDYAFWYFLHVGKTLQSRNQYCRAMKTVETGIVDLNYRFQQHGLGYEFINGELIRIDNEMIHHEYVKPALCLLHENGFDGAEEEYKKAFIALRNKDSKTAIIEAEKAFESTMKIICAKREYPFDPEKDSAKKLIERLKSSNFFPEYMENQLNAIVTALVSGAPTIRNRTSGHGQGEESVDIPDSYAKYVIGLVAVNIVFLVQLYKEK